MDIADVSFEPVIVKTFEGRNQQVFRTRFSIIRSRVSYRLWFYPEKTKREHPTFSLWAWAIMSDFSNSTSIPVFRMECELVAQAVLWEMTRDVSTEDVCIRGVSPSSIERPARDAIEASRARHTHRARQDNRNGDRRTGRGLSRLAHSSLYVYIVWVWRKLATWKKQQSVEH